MPARAARLSAALAAMLAVAPIAADAASIPADSGFTVVDLRESATWSVMSLDQRGNQPAGCVAVVAKHTPGQGSPYHVSVLIRNDFPADGARDHLFQVTLMRAGAHVGYETATLHSGTNPPARLVDADDEAPALKRLVADYPDPPALTRDAPASDFAVAFQLTGTPDKLWLRFPRADVASIERYRDCLDARSTG